jgi:hypothetical protein
LKLKFRGRAQARAALGERHDRSSPAASCTRRARIRVRPPAPPVALAGAGAQADYKPTQADWSAIREVIRAQIDAFRQDKDEFAFSYATPGIREQFKTAENFMHMVKTSYPAVYRPTSVAFV